MLLTLRMPFIAEGSKKHLSTSKNIPISRTRSIGGSLTRILWTTPVSMRIGPNVPAGPTLTPVVLSAMGVLRVGDDRAKTCHETTHVTRVQPLEAGIRNPAWSGVLHAGAGRTLGSCPLSEC